MCGLKICVNQFSYDGVGVKNTLRENSLDKNLIDEENVKNMYSKCHAKQKFLRPIIFPHIINFLFMVTYAPDLAIT